MLGTERSIQIQIKRSTKIVVRLRKNNGYLLFFVILQIQLLECRLMLLSNEE